MSDSFNLEKRLKEFEKILTKPSESDKEKRNNFLSIENLKILNSAAKNPNLIDFLKNFKKNSYMIQKNDDFIIPGEVHENSATCLSYWEYFPKFYKILENAAEMADIELGYAQLDLLREELPVNFLFNGIQLYSPINLEAKKILKKCQKNMAEFLYHVWIKKDFLFSPSIPDEVIYKIKPIIKYKIRKINRKKKLRKKWKNVKLLEFLYKTLDQSILPTKNMWLKTPESPVFTSLLKIILELLSVGFFKIDDTEQLIDNLHIYANRISTLYEIVDNNIKSRQVNLTPDNKGTHETVETEENEFENDKLNMTNRFDEQKRRMDEENVNFGIMFRDLKIVLQKIMIQIIHLLNDEFLKSEGAHKDESASVYLKDFIGIQSGSSKKHLKQIKNAVLLISDVLFEIILRDSIAGVELPIETTAITERLVMFVLDFKHQKLYPSNTYDYTQNEVQERRYINKGATIGTRMKTLKKNKKVGFSSIKNVVKKTIDNNFKEKDNFKFDSQYIEYILRSLVYGFKVNSSKSKTYLENKQISDESNQDLMSPDLSIKHQKRVN